MEQLVSNVQSFQKYLFGQDLELPELQSLFNSDKYQKVTQGICGSDHPFSKRVQVNLIIMVPGQDLPMHLDLPWFRSKSHKKRQKVVNFHSKDKKKKKKKFE